MGRQYEVVWTNLSGRQMKQLFDYISRDSVTNASKVVRDIAEAVNKTINNPEVYSPDKYKIDNDGSYRPFENITIEYHTGSQKNVIRVLRVRPTSLKPRPY
jgi:plasmid stabilization system protein ParE